MTTASPSVHLDLDRILGDYKGSEPGQTVIVVGALHGNEKEGVPAIRSVLETLKGTRPAFRGRLLGLGGNLAAYRRGRRFLDYDLNRTWRPELMREDRALSEQKEMWALAEILDNCFAETKGPVNLIDFHSFSGEGEPFAVSPGNDRDLILLRDLPMPTVYGLDDMVHGTLAHYVHNKGHRAIGFEGGRKGDPMTVRHMEAFLWDELVLSGCIAEQEIPEAPKLLWRSLHARLRLPKAIRVDYRHRIEPGSGFFMEPGFRSFQTVYRGQRLARDLNGPIYAPEDGYLLMPLYQGQGEDGFFIGHVEPTGLL